MWGAIGKVVQDFRASTEPGAPTPRRQTNTQTPHGPPKPGLDLKPGAMTFGSLFSVSWQAASRAVPDIYDNLRANSTPTPRASPAAPHSFSARTPTAQQCTGAKQLPSSTGSSFDRRSVYALSG
eukprot:4782002-Pleurochrysis_carterae.AAC.2